MFSKRLTYLMDTLELSATDLAGYAQIDRSSISRMKNGSRKPRENGASIRKLIHGIIRYTEGSKKTDILQKLTGTDKGSSRERLASALKSWLYQDSTSNRKEETTAPEQNAVPSFGNRLNDVMELAGISNIRLSRLVYADASLISRYRNSQRRPKSGSDMAERISKVLWERLEKGGRIEELCDLMGQPETDETAFYAWLFENGREVQNAGAVAGKLISLINTEVSRPSPMDEHPVFPETEIKDLYYGTEGLRTAALRFLKEAAELHVPQMYLYSDEDMSWLSGDPVYFRIWASLMRMCTENHTKITVIHHVNRSLRELSDAISGWLPLYLSGMVSSYFRKKDERSLFSNTLFLIPGTACIRASHVKGSEKDGIYHYHTDERSLTQYEKEFRSLIAQSSPLFSIRPGIRIPESRELIIIRNSLPLAAMSQNTVRSFHSEDLYSRWEASKYRFDNLGSIREYIPLTKPGIPYTEEQYQHHIEDIRKLALEHPQYHLVFLENCLYDNVEIFIAEDKVAVFRMEPSPITFETSHPQICRTFRDYADKLPVSE